jgi:hypothetical protein
VLHRIPRRAVGGVRLRSKLLGRVADAAAVAVVWTDGALAGDAVVVLEAAALSGFPVAVSFVRALYRRMRAVLSHHISDPRDSPVCNPQLSLISCSNTARRRNSLGTSPLGAVGLSPCGITVGSGVAGALVVGAAGSVSAAAVGAVSVHRCDGGEGEGEGDGGVAHLQDWRCAAVPGCDLRRDSADLEALEGLLTAAEE